MRFRSVCVLATVLFVGALLGKPVMGQLIDRTMAPNAANLGIAKSFLEQIGVGRGDVNRPNSSLFIINRDPARAIRRGRQIFQRKFTREQGQGPLTGDGAGNPEIDKIIGAGLMDSCAGCHGRPRGSCRLRRRRRHAARQPRRPASVRSGTEGDAGRPDYRRLAENPRGRHLGCPPGPQDGHQEASRQRHLSHAGLRLDHGVPGRPCGYVTSGRRGSRPPGPPVLRPRRNHVDS